MRLQEAGRVGGRWSEGEEGRGEEQRQGGEGESAAHLQRFGPVSKPVKAG